MLEYDKKYHIGNGYYILKYNCNLYQIYRLTGYIASIFAINDDGEARLWDGYAYYNKTTLKLIKRFFKNNK